MNRLSVVVLLLAISIPAVMTGAHAESITNLDTKVATGSGLTYRMLLGRIFRGAGQDPTSPDLITAAEKPLRRPGVKERTILPKGTRINSLEALKVRGDGTRYLVLLAGAETSATDVSGSGASVLALFREGDTAPLDVAEVKSDTLCFIGPGPLLSIGAGEAFTVVNHHFNSNQGYLDTTLFHIHQGRLQRIASVFTLSLNSMCEKSFSETLAWHTRQSYGSPYPDIVATVMLTMGPDQRTDDCPEDTPSIQPRIFSETYRWDKTKNRYVKDGREGFELLQRFNGDNF